ncbi:MAG: MoaD/ThiS family protein [Deltaproteobacteria bacterium]|nr:MoaD/ThiS family protein [Deltaproteobacteria bacterium]
MSGDTIHVTVRLFSHAKYALGQNELSLTMPAGARASDVEARVRELGGERIANLPMRVAVNQGYVDADAVLSDGDEVALIPPVQGG